MFKGLSVMVGQAIQMGTKREKQQQMEPFEVLVSRLSKCLLQI